MPSKSLVAIAAVTAVVVFGIAFVVSRRGGSGERVELPSAAPSGAEMPPETPPETSAPALSTPGLRDVEEVVRVALAATFGSAEVVNYFGPGSGVAPEGGASLEYHVGRYLGSDGAAAVVQALERKGFTSLGTGTEDGTASFCVENARFIVSGLFTVGEDTLSVVIADRATEEGGEAHEE